MHKIQLSKDKTKPSDQREYIWERCPTEGCIGRHTNWYFEPSQETAICEKCNRELLGLRFLKRPQSRINYHLDFKLYSV